MMIIMEPGSTREQIDNVIGRVHDNKLSAHTNVGDEQTIIGVVGENHVSTNIFESLPNVREVHCISEAYELASRQFHPEDSCFSLDGFTVGGSEIPIIAGPCSVESRSQVIEIAQAVKEAGANALRGGGLQTAQIPVFFPGFGRRRA